jgi:hypothetical protein
MNTFIVSVTQNIILPPPVNLRAESNASSCSSDVSCHNRILVSAKSDLSNVVTENLSDATNVSTSLNPVCVAIDNCSLSVTEPSVKKFSETGSQTDFQEDAPSVKSSSCKDKSLSNVKLLSTPGVTAETHCDLTSPP